MSIERLDALILTPRNTFLHGYVIDTGGKDLELGVIYGDASKTPKPGDKIEFVDTLIREEERGLIA